MDRLTSLPFLILLWDVAVDAFLSPATTIHERRSGFHDNRHDNDRTRTFAVGSDIFGAIAGEDSAANDNSATANRWPWRHGADAPRHHGSPANGGAKSTATGEDAEYFAMTTLPRHPTNEGANEILIQTEIALRGMQEKQLFLSNVERGSYVDREEDVLPSEAEMESVYANSYVDLGKVDTVGFDYDYTLVTYTTELLELIYDMALKRLVEEKEYPREMLEAGMKFDPFFSIRGERAFIVGIIACFLARAFTSLSGVLFVGFRSLVMRDVTCTPCYRIGFQFSIVCVRGKVSTRVMAASFLKTFCAR